MERSIIVGAGLAGLSAAIALAEGGAVSELISAQPSERAQSVLAEGGVNAALDLMGEGDSPAQHFEDSLRGGVYLADAAALRDLTEAAPGIVRRLAALGVPFQSENGRMVQRNFGGQKKKRTAFVKSGTGKQLMTALIDRARKSEAEGLIRRWPAHELLDILTENGACTGVRIRDRQSGEGWELYGPVILCCGGLNGLFPGLTTGTTQNSGDAAAAAFAAGARMANLEMIQYHPTTFAIPGKRCLVSEAARGEGGRLFVRRGGEDWYYMEELYPEQGNLAPRDVVSRETWRLLRRGDCGERAYLDLRALPKRIWRERLSDLREECVHYLHIDPAKEPLPVEPGIHYFMGGVDVDRRHRSSLPGLYAAGECACQYHGANRLGGNSMLGAIYGGQTAARECLARPDEVPAREKRSLGPLPEPDAPGAEARAAELGSILGEALGIERDAAGLTRGLAAVDRLLAAPLPERERRRALLGKAMLLSALERRESRGAQLRSDYPERDDGHWRAATLAEMKDGKIVMGRRPVEENGDEAAV